LINQNIVIVKLIPDVKKWSWKLGITLVTNIHILHISEWTSNCGSVHS